MGHHPQYGPVPSPWPVGIAVLDLVYLPGSPGQCKTLGRTDHFPGQTHQLRIVKGKHVSDEGKIGRIVHDRTVKIPPIGHIFLDDPRRVVLGDREIHLSQVMSCEGRELGIQIPGTDLG